eukprot:jgi/Picre1/31009/NNA_006367.t1
MSVEEWQLSAEQRADTIARIKASMATMYFFQNGNDAQNQDLGAMAAMIEKKAYTVAQVEAKTTTGVRPHHETLKAYVRKLSSLVLEAVSGKLELQSTQQGDAMDVDSIDLTGSREFLTTETAEEALAPMLQDGASVSRIKFSTKSFGIDAAHVAARAIRNVSSTLKHADLSDIIAGRPEEEALKALEIISEALAEAELDSLDLSDNALGEKGIRACAAVIQKQKNLKHIAFQNVGCSEFGCAAVNELLVHCGNLRSIHLLNNMSGDSGAMSIAKIIERCPLLEDFKMASSRVGEEGGKAIADALAVCGHAMVRIDLHDNPLTDESAESLAKAIKSHPCLKALNLNDIAMEDPGIQIIAESLCAVSKTIEHLELELNSITENELEDDGALEIAKSLLGLKKLEVVDMRTNQIGRGGAVALAKACVTIPSVKELLLDDNEISEAGVDALVEVLKKGKKEDILGSLEDNLADEDDEGGSNEEGHETLDKAVDDIVAALQSEHL